VISLAGQEWDATDAALRKKARTFGLVSRTTAHAARQACSAGGTRALAACAPPRRPTALRLGRVGGARCVGAARAARRGGQQGPQAAEQQHRGFPNKETVCGRAGGAPYPALNVKLLSARLAAHSNPASQVDAEEQELGSDSGGAGAGAGERHSFLGV